jgi:apolipoprotein N-acyltransferase
LSGTTLSRSRLGAVGAIGASALAYALYSRSVWPWIALGWVGLVPWLALLDGVRSARGALAAGVGLAIAFELAVFGWFVFAIGDYTGVAPALLAALLAAAGPLLQPQFVTSALARTYVRGRGAGVAVTTLVTASIYVATEHYAPKLFGDSLGYCLLGAAWLRQAADLAGVPLLTFAMVVVNECVWAAFRNRAAGLCRPVLAPLAGVAAVLAALAGYGAWRTAELTASAADAAPVTVALVQAGLGHYDRMAEEIGRYETVRLILDEHTTRSAAALARGDVDLLVWPETVYPTTFGRPKSADGDAFDRELAAFVARAGVPLIFGSYALAGSEEFNAALFLAPDAGGPHPFATYRKTRLFPLTERVPALLDSDWARAAMPWLGTWKPGAGATVVPVAVKGRPPVMTAPLICYDVLDSALAHEAARAGAEMIVTLSNDSWFGSGPGGRLHQLGAAFRSIETRRPQVRATNTGISAVIAADGTLVATAGAEERATLIGRVVPERQRVTLVMRWGEWLGPVALVVAAVLVMAVGRGPSRGFSGRFSGIA